MFEEFRSEIKHLIIISLRCQNMKYLRFIKSLSTDILIYIQFYIRIIRIINLIFGIFSLIFFHNIQSFYFSLIRNVSCYLVFINKTFIIQCLLSFHFNLVMLTLYKKKFNSNRRKGSSTLNNVTVKTTFG